MTEILLPLGLNSQGRIATTNDPNVAARQHLTSYLMTRPGERLMRPTFGTAISNFVFENLDPVNYELLAVRVKDKVRADVPDVVMSDIATKENSAAGELHLTVSFSLSAGLGQGVQQSTTLTLGGSK